MASHVTLIKQCKVCNSKFRNKIEDLHSKGMNPQKIFEYLQNISEPYEAAIVKDEDIQPSAIRRHMDKHFNPQDEAIRQIAETKSRVEKSREDYKKGVQTVINNVSTLSHMIELALIKMEEVDNLPKDKDKHTLTISYMTQVRGLIESLAKLTGDLKQEGTIDINFFSNEIQIFAEIVLSVIRQIDIDLGLNHRLEYAFADEFKKQWDTYQLRQARILNGELSPDDGLKQRNVNTFNDSETITGGKSDG
jgi:hypothetical protein